MIGKINTPVWLWIGGGLGALWYALGSFQLVKALSKSQQSLMAIGMTDAAVVAYLGQTLASGMRTLGGLLGCILLLMRKSLALPVLGMSMAASIVLFLEHWAYGKLVPGQLAVLLTVEIIAAGLLFLAWRMKASGRLNR